MRKRILSLLLALTLALSAGVFGVIPALAADSCVSVKADAVTTGEVVAGSLLEIKLTDVFEDTDGHSLVVTIPSRAKVEMVRKTNSLSGVRITDTIARGKVIGVNEGVVTVKPMVSRTNVAKLQSLASTNTMVGVNAIENKMKTFG